MTAQASLFDAPVIDSRPISAARASDPDTSHQAARTNRKGRQTHRLRLLHIYALDDAIEGEGLTDEEAAEQAGVERIEATRRLSECRSHGWIIDTGRRRPTSTGCMAMVCLLTPAGLEVLRSER